MYRNLSRFIKEISYKHPFSFHVCQRVCSNLQGFQLDKRTEKFSDIFYSYGFKQGQINRILRSPEFILSYSEEEIMSNLKIWLCFDYVNDKLFTVLSSNPELLTLNPDYIKNRFTELMTLFTKKDINKLLVTCPSVFIDDFSTVYDKVEYILHMMGVEQKSIVKSEALQYDLHHIKCRHIFMIRAGFYLVNKRSVKNRNAPLHKIFSRNMKTFLRLTRLTEEEYNAFCLSYKEELLDEEESDDES